MSLYTHFRNKSELLDLMLDEIAARVFRCEWQSTWQAELLAMCRRVRDLFTEHPRWISLLSRSVWSAEMPLKEHVLKLMVEDGIAETDGLTALSSTVVSVLGLVLVEHTLMGPGECGVGRSFEPLKVRVQAAADLPGAESMTVAPKLRGLELDRVFELSVDALVAGFHIRRGAAQ
jgi:AcrR family transcriptional regulator